MGTERRRQRRAESPRCLEARHEGPPPADAAGRSEPIAALPSAHRPIMEFAPPPAVAAAPDEFAALLRRQGLLAANLNETHGSHGTYLSHSPTAPVQTEGTTILAFKFAD